METPSADYRKKKKFTHTYLIYTINNCMGSGSYKFVKGFELKIKQLKDKAYSFCELMNYFGCISLLKC